MTSGQLTIQSSFETFSDSRTHGYQGQTRNVRLQRAAPSGGGAISKGQDGLRCAVTGYESLRILRIYDPDTQPPKSQSSSIHKHASGPGGFRINASKNLWEGSGQNSTSTDVAWCHAQFSNKIVTSARSGELIMWDLNKSGSSRFERKVKDHLRSIHKVSASSIVPHYCITGSSDGDLRVWDLRSFNKSIMRIHHPTGVRGVVFSPVMWQPLQAAVGLDNGNIYRWDLKMGQRGQLDRIPVAHSASVTSLDWCSSSSETSSATPSAIENTGNGQGWIVSGGLDRCVKVWDLTALTSNAPSQHIPHKPAYVLHPSFPILGLGVMQIWVHSIASAPPTQAQSMLNRRGSGLGLEISGEREPRARSSGNITPTITKNTSAPSTSGAGDPVEIWDVRRSWIAKWTVPGSAVDGGCTDVVFGDSHAIWAQHSTGMFSQIDLRDTIRPIDAIPRATVAWEASGSLTFVADPQREWEVPYDDLLPEVKQEAKSKGRTVKQLGDPVYSGFSRGIGVHYGEDALFKLEMFTNLARRYIIEGEDRAQTCAVNAETAFRAGHHQAAQVWLLIAASVTNIIPETPPIPVAQPKKPPRPKPIPMEHSYSAPAAMSSIPFTFPQVVSKTSPGRTSTLGSDKVSIPNQNPNQNGNSNHVSQRSMSATSSGFRRVTPGSSAHSSPHQGSSALPPSPLTSKHPSYLGRRESVDSGLSVASSSRLSGGAASSSRRLSSLRRPSVSTTHSPSSLSLKHVGEGALDDSDSDSSSGSGVSGVGGVGKSGGPFSDDEEEASNLRPLISPALVPTRIANPSPLSRVIRHHRWVQLEDGMDERDDDGGDTPSPRSTDSESISDVDVGGNAATPHAIRTIMTRRRSSTTAIKRKSKSRSQSSFGIPKANRSSSASGVVPLGIGGDDREQSVSTESKTGVIKEPRSATNHHREKSVAVSELILNDGDSTSVPGSSEALVITWTQRDPEIVVAEEKRFRQITWDALRGSLEDFAESGDVQMCAMMAMLIPQELGLKPKRVLAFIESYIDTLTRLKLYPCAAYIRKHSKVDAIYGTTLVFRWKPSSTPPVDVVEEHLFLHMLLRMLEGPIPIVQPAGKTTMTCSICRLPVRGLLFQCSICSHGGHQECYNYYYAQHPMVDLPSQYSSDKAKETSDQANANENVASEDETATLNASSHVNAPHVLPPKLAGRPCAAGCGHYCWLVNV
ncbi:hypothetical protein D9758_004483 [Tetrapyrgos nigripes]|uniref:WDR59/RTC1-like RING zinc finger domain-containing protein n=1 Tax=Tetrapyrgos nigripes TaxID=182062 RepID=A0A8H5GN86_9AGAR|nr:hypothetical protein D9758_004483 [Tetrapyrgos nigripes]